MKTTFVKSPLRYPGGKSRAVSTLLPMFPDFKEYREPFLDGGSIFFALNSKQPGIRFSLNDIYPELINFWKSIQNSVDIVIDEVNRLKLKYTIGRDLYRAMLKLIAHEEPIERAAAFFILNRITFSGTIESGGYSEQAFLHRFTDSSIHRLKLSSHCLNNAELTCEDYEALIEKHGNNVFIFLDPPYYSARKSALYGKNGSLHTNFNHQRFAEVMKQCRHRWLITYDNSSYIKDLFSFANIKEWDLIYGMRNQKESSNQVGKELIIKNY